MVSENRQSKEDLMKGRSRRRSAGSVKGLVTATAIALVALGATPFSVAAAAQAATT
jgi:hypothetical protein